MRDERGETPIADCLLTGPRTNARESSYKLCP
jgi:hypothetical protein